MGKPKTNKMKNIKIKYYGCDREFNFTEDGEVLIGIEDILLIQTYKVPKELNGKKGKYFLLQIKNGPTFLIDKETKIEIEKIFDTEVIELK